MKKLFSLVLAVAMVLSMACFASAEENTTLTIVAWDVGTTPYYQAQKEAFEATHPGVTIEYVDVASQDWDTKAGTMLSGGDTSDLFMVKQNINIMNWAQQGFAEPLTDYIAQGQLRSVRLRGHGTQLRAGRHAVRAAFPL